MGVHQEMKTNVTMGQFRNLFQANSEISELAQALHVCGNEILAAKLTSIYHLILVNLQAVSTAVAFKAYEIEKKK